MHTQVGRGNLALRYSRFDDHIPDFGGKMEFPMFCRNQEPFCIEWRNECRTLLTQERRNENINLNKYLIYFVECFDQAKCGGDSVTVYSYAIYLI